MSKPTHDDAVAPPKTSHVSVQITADIYNLTVGRLRWLVAIADRIGIADDEPVYLSFNQIDDVDGITIFIDASDLAKIADLK